MRLRISLIIFVFGTISCGDYGRRWSDYIEYKFSNDSVYWTEDQTITQDFFIGEKGEYACYYDYFGVTALWDPADASKFNIRIYFDKKKSWMKPESEWVNFTVMPKSKKLNYQGQFSQIPKLLKIKFDYLEYGARELRKYLKQNSEVVTDSNIKNFIDSYSSKAFQEWANIQEELGDNISDSNLKPLRVMVDKKLKELEDFDPRVNSDL